MKPNQIRANNVDRAPERVPNSSNEKLSKQSGAIATTAIAVSTVRTRSGNASASVRRTG